MEGQLKVGLNKFEVVFLGGSFVDMKIVSEFRLDGVDCGYIAVICYFRFRDIRLQYLYF